MVNYNSCLSIGLFLVAILNVSCHDKYEQELFYKRKSFLMDERRGAMGHRILLNTFENKANEILMRLKFEELEEGFKDPTKFLPSKSFLEVADKIKESKVFQLLKAMPKGAVLHGHCSAMVSGDFLYRLTYLKNLYVKIKGDNKLLEFKISQTSPPNDTDACIDCAWHNLQGLRLTQGRRKVREWLKPQIGLNKKHADLDSNTVWKSFSVLFKLIAPLVSYMPAWWLTLYNTFKEYHEDNVSYMEIRSRFKDLYRLDGTKKEALDVVEYDKHILKVFRKHHPDFYGARFIYSPSRSLNATTFQPHINMISRLLEHHPDFVAGFDLVGHEDTRPTLQSLAGGLLKLKGETNFYFHAGETNWNGFKVDENLVDAILLGTKRIGHGYAIPKHPKVAQYVKQNKIGIELCPISHQVLGLVKDLRNHPAASMFTEDYPFVIAPDDPGFWGAKGVSYDWYEVFMGIAAKWQDLRFLKQLALNSIQQTSLSKNEKRELKKLWERKWGKFIMDVIKCNGHFPCGKSHVHHMPYPEVIEKPLDKKY